MNYDGSLESMDESTLPPHREWPLVSVIVATYKRARMLRRALDSVLAQTFKDIEVWVIHDGPPDDATIQVFEDYAVKFDEAGVDFWPVSTEEHTGYYTFPRNQATENSRGVYVANLDDDNEWMPDALESLVAAMDEGEVWPDLVYGRRCYVLDPEAPTSKDGIDLTKLAGDSEFVPWDEMAEIRISGNQPMLNFIDSSDFLVAKGALYRLASAMGHIWRDEARRFGDFWLVSDGLLAAKWRFKPLDKVVQIYHLHDENVSLTRPINELPNEVKV